MKVLILTSSTGGGHDMRANSFKAWANSSAGKTANLEVSIHQTLESTHPLYLFGVNLYNFIQKTYPLAHHLYFQYLERIPHFDTPQMIHGRRKFQQTIISEKPDIVLSAHAHLNHGFFQLAKDALPECPPLTVTYCGELYGTYGFSRRWVNPLADHFIGAMPQTCQAANRLKMPKERNHCLGFLLSPHFYQAPLSKPERRSYIEEVLQLNPDKFILILGTGANSANNHHSFLRALEVSGIKDLQIVVLCGKSQHLFTRMTEYRRTSPLNIQPLPYLENPSPLFQSADALVCRPGTGLTSEAIMSGLPMLHNTLGGTMPQEAITLAFCKKYNLSTQIRKARELPAILKTYMQSSHLLKERKENLQKIRPEFTPVAIIENLRKWHRTLRHS